MNDKERIESVIQLYIDSMNDSDPAKVKQAFMAARRWLVICMTILWK